MNMEIGDEAGIRAHPTMFHLEASVLEPYLELLRELRQEGCQ